MKTQSPKPKRRTWKVCWLVVDDEGPTTLQFFKTRKAAEDWHSPDDLCRERVVHATLTLTGKRRKRSQP